MTEQYINDFKEWLLENGAEIIPTTNQYEAVRYKGMNVGVLYTSGNVSGIAAQKTMQEFARRKQWSDRPNRFKRKDNRKKKLALIKRDGTKCFYCGKEMYDDVTLEHLIPLTSGGSNKLSNAVLAHSNCNNDVGHKSLNEKIEIAIRNRMKNESTSREKS